MITKSLKSMGDTARLTLLALRDNPLNIEPSSVSRDWMDQTSGHFAYRCTPINIANSSGWIAQNPFAFEVFWNGGISTESITISPENDNLAWKKVVSSHFGHGILTFHLGWLLRSSPGWAVWARGCPNQSKAGIYPLEGIVETEWLDFPFTMNWRFTESRLIKFEAGEPIYFFFLVPHPGPDQTVPRLDHIDNFPDTRARFEEWRDSRDAFNAALHTPGTEAFQVKWQKKYLNGVGNADECYHVIKRTLKKPKRDAN